MAARPYAPPGGKLRWAYEWTGPVIMQGVIVWSRVSGASREIPVYKPPPLPSPFNRQQSNSILHCVLFSASECPQWLSELFLVTDCCAGYKSFFCIECAVENYIPRHCSISKWLSKDQVSQSVSFTINWIKPNDYAGGGDIPEHVLSIPICDRPDSNCPRHSVNGTVTKWVRAPCELVC